LTSSGSPTSNHKGIIIEAAPGCTAILARHHPILNHSVDPEISLALLEQAATVLLQAEASQQGIIGLQIQALPEQSAQAKCEMFAHLVASSRDSSSILSLYPNIARSTSLCLRACGDFLSVPDTSGTGAEMLSTAFNVTRLALLGKHAEASGVFWARTWPDWQRLLNLSNEINCVNSVSPEIFTRPHADI
jgi:hypothetical protein